MDEFQVLLGPYASYYYTFSLFGFAQMVKELVDIGLQKKSCEQVCDPKINCHSLLNGSDDCSYQHWRSVLESICHSLNLSEGGVDSGLQHCLNNALRSNPGSSHANLVKVCG